LALLLIQEREVKNLKNGQNSSANFISATSEPIHTNGFLGLPLFVLQERKEKFQK